MFEVWPPVFPASGTFGYGYEYSELIDYRCIGAIVTKGITRHQRNGNPQPRMFEIDGGLINSVGLENVGIDAFVKDVIPEIQTLNKPIIVNLAGFTVDDFGYMIHKLNEIDEIIAFEINLSCPNVKEGGTTWQENPEQLYGLAKKLSQISQKKLFYKISPYPDIENIVTPLKDGGAEALNIGNTLKVTYFIHNKFLIGGLSGPVLKHFTQLAIKKVKEKYSDLQIIACGGINSIADILQYKKIGADFFEIGTALFSNPKIFEQIYSVWRRDEFK